MEETEGDTEACPTLLRGREWLSPLPEPEEVELWCGLANDLLLDSSVVGLDAGNISVDSPTSTVHAFEVWYDQLTKYEAEI